MSLNKLHVCCKILLAMSVASLTTLAIAQDKKQEALLIQEPLVRIAGRPQKDKDSECLFLGIAMDQQTVVTNLSNIEKLSDVTLVLSNEKRVTPTAITHFPEAGIAALSVQSQLRSTDPRDINEGDEVRLLSFSSQTNSLCMTRGLVNNEPTEAGRFTISVAISSPLSHGIVTDKKNRVLGISLQDAPTMEALDIGAIKALLKR